MVYGRNFRAAGCLDPAGNCSLGEFEMAKILGNFHLALLIGILLLIAAMVGFHQGGMDKSYWVEVLRFLHVWAGMLWIGLL